MVSAGVSEMLEGLNPDRTRKRRSCWLADGGDNCYCYCDWDCDCEVFLLIIVLPSFDSLILLFSGSFILSLSDISSLIVTVTSPVCLLLSIFILACYYSPKGISANLILILLQLASVDLLDLLDLLHLSSN